MESHTVRMSDGASLYVKVLGNLASTKPLLIALHGAPGLSDHREPEKTFGFLQSHFRVLIYDARGSGTSDLQPPYTNARWVADVDELRAWVGVERFVLAGGSYGGFVSLDYAVAHQSRLMALLLRDTWAWGLGGQMHCLKESLTSSRLKADPERQLRLWSGTLLDDQDFEDAVSEMAALFTAEEEESTTKEDSSVPDPEVRPRMSFHSATQNAAFSYNMPRYDVRSNLKDITVPTILITSRQDRLAPLSFSEEMHRQLPNSVLAIFEKSGHNPATDEPVLFKQRLCQFVRDAKLVG